MNYNSIDEAVCSFLDNSSQPFKHDYWAASAAGSCLRKQYYKRDGVEGKQVVNYSNRMQAYDGDGIHIKIQNIFAKLGILVEAEVSLINETYHLKGKPDAVIQLADGKCLLDIKTQNQKGWARRKVKGVRTVDEHHRKQVLLYYYFLKEKYPDLNSARIYYINRNTGEREEFVLNYSPGEISQALDELKMLNEFYDSKTLPEKTSDTDQCRFCEFGYICYNGETPPCKKYRR